MRTGVSLEKDVFQIIEKKEWGIRWDETLDLHHGIDRIFEKRWGNTLPVFGAVQLTLMGGNAEKLERFVRTRVQFPDMAHFYSVVERDMEPDEAANQLSDMLEWYLIFKPPRPGIHGIFLCKGKNWKSFNTSGRIAKLRSRADPAVTAELRKSGKICFLAPNGFRVRCTENGREYAAFDADAEGGLKSYLKNYRKSHGPSPIGLVVNFIAYEDHEGRDRALSVIFNAIATAARNH